MDTRLDILGVVLIIFALITLLSFLSKEPGALTRVWLRTLYQGFGWGAWVVPIPIGGIGVWLIWRHFGDQLPAVDPIRIAGVGIAFVGALVLAQAVVSAISPIGTVWYNPAYANPASPEYDSVRPNKVWEEAVACPARPQELINQGWVQTQAYWSSADIARCGHGGGFIGSAIQLAIQGLIGGAAVFIISLAAVFGGALMTTRKSLKDVLEYTSQGYGWVRDRRTATSQPDLEDEEEKDTKTVKQVPLPAGGRAGQSTRPGSETGKVAAAPPSDAGEDEEKKPAPALPGRPSIVTGRGPSGEQSASALAAAAGSPGAVAAPPQPGEAPDSRPSPIGTSQPVPKPGAESDEEEKKPDEQPDRPSGMSGLPRPPGGSGPGPSGPPSPGGPPGLPRPGSPTGSSELSGSVPGSRPGGPHSSGSPGGPPGLPRPGSPAGSSESSGGLPGSRPGGPPSAGSPGGPPGLPRPGSPAGSSEASGGLPGSRPGGPPSSGSPDGPPGLPRPSSPPDEPSGLSTPDRPPGLPRPGSPQGSSGPDGLPGSRPPLPPPSGGPGSSGPGASGLPRPGGPPPLTRPEADDSEPDDDGMSPGGGPSGRPIPPRPGSPLSGASRTAPDLPGKKTGPAALASPAPPASTRPGLPAPDKPNPSGAPASRTFGPTPPASLGGLPRPAPKPATPEKVAANNSTDADDDIVFDDLADEDRLLADAIDVADDQAEPSAGKAIKEPAEEPEGNNTDDEEAKPAALAAKPPETPKTERDETKSAVVVPPPPATRPALPALSSAASPPLDDRGEPKKPSAAVEKSPEVTPAQDRSEVKAPSPPGEAVKSDKEDKKPAADAEKRKSTPPKVAKKAPGGPDWKMPDVGKMLNPTQKQSISDEELRHRAEVIEQTLSSFGAPARVVEVNNGPVITQFGVEPDYIDGRGGKRVKVKVGKISALADDIALALAAPTIRIEAPVPGKGFVGIEVPNAEPSIVGLRDVMDTPEFAKIKSPLKMALGQDVSGAPICADLTSMPHLLVAGTTGSGKSVCVNGIICTMLMNMTPDELKMIMVDPKRVELTNYNGIPHLMAPVVTELERIVGVLKWVQREMDDRYRKFAMAGARNISDYNQRVEKGRVEDDRLPYILVIVDELADLMMLAPDETERVITRLAQMARATGIHIILSTQRPSVDVVTGLIKANFPARIAFAVATGVDSRVILDVPGAEKLLGRGDMLFQAPDAPLPTRMQGVFLSDQEIDRIVQHWRKESDKLPDALKAGGSDEGSTSYTATQKPLFSADDDKDDDVDDLYDEAVELVRDMEKASISLLQRHLRIGYTRAARLIEAMEERGIVGGHEGGSAPREVLEDEED